MKKITSFIFTCAFLAGLTGLVGCQNNTDDEPGGSGNTGGTETASVNLAEGGIFGKMQDWKAENVKWSTSNPTAGTYEYKFVAPAAEVEWKVLVKKGKTDEGAYVGDLNDKGNKFEVKVGADAHPLNYAKKADDGSSLITKDLETGKEYKIIVTVKDKAVSAKVERVQGPALALDILKEGGIIGDVNKGGWDGDKPAAWSKAGDKDGIYEYEFTAEKAEVDWKVLIKKGADKNDYSSGYYCGLDADPGKKYWIVLGEKKGALTLYKHPAAKGGNLFTNGLTLNQKYKIVVTVKGDQVLAKIEEGKNPDLAKALFKEGGIVGDVNEKGWDTSSPATWSKVGDKDGIYEYTFTAKKSAVEWKVLIKKGATNNDYSSGYYCGNSKDPYGINLSDKDPLPIYKFTKDGSNLRSENLAIGAEYKITIKIDGSKVFASIKEVSGKLSPALLKDGGISLNGAVKPWKGMPDTTNGKYEYDFIADGDSLKFKIVDKKTNPTLFFGGDSANEWNIDALNKSIPLYKSKDNKAKECVVQKLTKDKKYRITVEIKGAQVWASVGEVPVPLKTDLFKDGGIVGDTQGWNAETPKWTGKNIQAQKAEYWYEFVPYSDAVQWKVLGQKGYKGIVYRGNDDQNATWNVNVGEDKPIELNKGAEDNDVGGNITTGKLESGCKYKLTISIVEDKVYAKVEKLPDAPSIPANILDKGGIVGTMLSNEAKEQWKIAADDNKWKAKKPNGVYEYEFEAHATRIEWKVLADLTAEKKNYFGGGLNLAEKPQVKVGEAAITLNSDYARENYRSNLYTDGLELGRKYKITVTAAAGKVSAKIEKLKLDKAILKDGSVFGSMHEWNNDSGAWTKDGKTDGIYEHKFTVPAKATRVEWKILLKKGDEAKGCYVGGTLSDKDAQKIEASKDAATAPKFSPIYYVDKVGDGGVIYAEDLKSEQPYTIIVKVTDEGVVVGLRKEAEVALPKGTFKNGCIIGSMHPSVTENNVKVWDFNPPESKWSNPTTEQDKGIYKYQFQAPTSEVHWKVLTERGNKTKVAYVGELANKDNKHEVKINGEIPLMKADKADDGSVIYAKDLAQDKWYEITVAIKGADVYTGIKKVDPQPKLNKAMFKKGCIVGTMHKLIINGDKKDWDLNPTFAWANPETEQNKGIYKYSFQTARDGNIEWKLMIEKNKLDAGVYVGDPANTANKIPVGSAETELKYNHRQFEGSNLTSKIEKDKTCTITIKVEDYKVTAKVELDKGKDKPKNLFARGGIVGDLEGWNPASAKWSVDGATTGIYKYTFVAQGTEMQWKVLENKGSFDKVYCDGEVGADKATTLTSHEKDGGNLVTKNLKIGHEYTLTVTVKDTVTAQLSAASTEAKAFSKDILKDGGIMGTMQDWDASTVKWTEANKTAAGVYTGEYSYTFKATKAETYWKVVTHKGAEKKSKVPVYGADKNDGMDVVLGGAEKDLTYLREINDGFGIKSTLQEGKNYKITVKVDGTKVKAKIELADENNKLDMFKDGGIFGTMNGWNTKTPGRWSNPTQAATGTYTYKFKALATTAEWKIMKVADQTNKGFYGSTDGNALELSVDGDAKQLGDQPDGNGGAVLLKDLSIGKEYTIEVKVETKKVTAKVKLTGTTAALDKDMLKDGGIVGDMQIGPWDPKIANWTKHTLGNNTYEYDFTADSQSAAWRVLVTKGDWKNGMFVGKLGEKDEGTLVNNSTVDMNYDNCKGEGSGGYFYANNLTEGQHYRITVTVETDKVTTKIGSITTEVKPAVDLTNGGIYGDFNGWNVNAANVEWTTKPAAASSIGKKLYVYEFTATSNAINWKVLLKKGFGTEGAFASGKGNDVWWVKSDGSEQKLSYDNKENNRKELHTEGLLAGTTYKITVTVDGNRVTAKVDKKN